MPVARKTIGFIPASETIDAAFLDVNVTVEPTVTGIPAAVSYRIAAQRRIEDEGSSQRIRAVVRVPVYAPVINPGDSILIQGDSKPYLVRSIIEPQQLGRWRKIVAERDM